MLRRLLVGLILGLIVGGLVAAALVAGLHQNLFADDTGGSAFAYLAAAVTGVLTGLVAGKPIWASGAKIRGRAQGVLRRASGGGADVRGAQVGELPGRRWVRGPARGRARGGPSARSVRSRSSPPSSGASSSSTTRRRCASRQRLALRRRRSASRTRRPPPPTARAKRGSRATRARRRNPRPSRPSAPRGRRLVSFGRSLRDRGVGLAQNTAVFLARPPSARSVSDEIHQPSLRKARVT